MDQAIRNKLRGVVTQCRKLLEDSVSQELQGKFGMYAAKKHDVHVDDDARMSHLSAEEQAARKDILDHFAHIKARSFKPSDALDQLVREIAFTHLNRLCAYKMMEARQVYVGDQKFREAVSRGINSNGVKFYLADHPEDERLYSTGKQDVAYRHYLDWLGGLLSGEIGVLFNPHDSANRLYPSQFVLDQVLDLINDASLAAIWAEDETIGWVYQYFTPKELRDQARKESAAPRNSYELAFRNQFFTPRYVVEFLTDNTLGRIWYEMRKGVTRLKDQCRYMVCRPNEIFEPQMNTDEHGSEITDSSLICVDPCSSVANSDLSQDELLKQPVHIPHRPKKDPRELRILDPACGSGHFLLYCFDLLLTIYEEAYTDPDLGPNLKAAYPTLEALRRDLPRLTLAHNLHGIDIDLRASQIAALALWLRCQRAYREMGLKQARPKITKSNIVCAEPMPGENPLLKDFVAQLQPKVLGQLVEIVFDKMKLAGEAGSLLKIEEELREAIAAAKQRWVAEHEQATDRKGRQLLFSRAEMERAANKTPQAQLFDFSEITDEQFWTEAEGQVLTALRSYAAHACNDGKLQRQLFAEDAAQGFAFIDLCQKRFDVVLMNPPFGMPSRPAKDYIGKSYPESKSDSYAAFVERGAEWLLYDSLLGAITSRTGFFLSSLQKWREGTLLSHSTLAVLGDLGFGVLDSAMVETAAYCLKTKAPKCNAVFFRLMNEENKALALFNSLTQCNGGTPSTLTYIADPSSFREVPGSPFAYWISGQVRRLFKELPCFENEDQGRAVRVGLQTSDDTRFLRLWWEVSPGKILDAASGPDWKTDPATFGAWCRQRTLQGKRWVLFPKGGGFSQFLADLHLVVNWENNGAEMKRFAEEMKRHVSSPPGNGPLRDFPFYFREGLTWSYRTHRLCLQELPAGTIISTRGSGVFAAGPTLEAWLALGNSKIVDSLVKVAMGREGHPQFDQGDLKAIPHPALSEDDYSQLGGLAKSCLSFKKRIATANETSVYATCPPVFHVSGTTLRERAIAWQTVVSETEAKLESQQAQIDVNAYRLFGINESVQRISEDGMISVNYSDEHDAENATHDEEGGQPTNELSAVSLVGGLFSYLLGAASGRWDIRRATGSVQMPDEFDPFAPPPVNPPGTLCGPHGELNARTNYPLHIDLDGVIPDDPDHSDDIIRRVREALELIWKDRADAIEKEAGEILGVKELRDYFRKPGKGGFWDDHVSRYSKSRRKAPIYWLLQSSKKNYGLWLYYHRLDKDIFFKTLLNYVEPKIRVEQSRLETLRSQKTAAGESGKEAKKLAKEMEKLEDFMSELRDFEDKLRRAAKLHLEPDLNDGVVLNIAPLHELVPWKEAKNYWNELLEGKYEWSSIGKQLRDRGLVT